MKDKITKRSSIRFSIIERINYYFSDPLKKHNNSIESVKETEKQSKEAANLSDFQSSYKGDNSPPKIRQGFALSYFWFEFGLVRDSRVEARARASGLRIEVNFRKLERKLHQPGGLCTGAHRQRCESLTFRQK